MDDDDFGGFEAAEIFDGGNGETQTTSPAIPWAAFPTVSGVHLSPASPEIVLDHDHTSPSVGCLSSEPIISSPENTHADNSIVSQTFPKAQIQQSAHTHLDISLFPLGLTEEKSNGTIALVDDSEDPGANVSNIQLQQKISSLEMKLKVSEEEKQRIKKDVESLMEKHSVLEKDFLKEKEQEAISFQDRYKELQEKHKQELEDMRKAGHEALSIIVDEYKHQRLLEMLATEKELLKEKIKEALTQQSQEQKEILEKCLEEERQRNKEALVSAAKLEKEVMKDAVLKAVEEERKNLEKAHAEERELWKTEHAKDQEKVSQAIQTAIQEQRKISQIGCLFPLHLLDLETVKAAIIEEQKRSEKAVEEAVKRTRDELIEYVKEQKRYTGPSLLWPLRLRSTSSGCAGSTAMAHGPSHSAACGIFPDRGTNPCPLHRHVGSQPLRHQGSPARVIKGSTLIVCYKHTTPQTPLQP
ncbi:coiled-coil domain-containing protein 91 isoform X6 [Orcinus orca]|uniref:coiled-coil domain-containing protein 91 isoform X6 n=1 Tax=Orcinus orca TaxID=9733 RepID=UPI002111B40E|nr:coiled-coil domain-containing protein 91 isoform X6 [Orcinus orca]